MSRRTMLLNAYFVGRKQDNSKLAAELCPNALDCKELFQELDDLFFEAEEILNELGFESANSNLTDDFIHPYNPHIRIYRNVGSQCWILTDGSGSINDNEQISYDDLKALKRYASML